MLNLIPYNNHSLRNAGRDFNKFFDEFFETGFDRVNNAYFKMDVEKSDDSYLVTAEVPGLDKDDIDIEIEDNMLTISVHEEDETKDEDDEQKYVYRERKTLNSVRKVSLEDIDESGITAQLENGLLKITLPIAEPVSNKKSIEID